MKKLINLIALVMLVSTNVLTPFSYAQEETPEVIPENEVGNVEEIGETPERGNEIAGEISDTLGEVEGERSLPLVREVVNESEPEGLKEEVEDSIDAVESPATDENKDEDTEKVEIDEAAQLVEGDTEREKQEENLEDNNEITEQENVEAEIQELQKNQEISTMDTTTNSKNIVLQATSTVANQTLKINKYFKNAYTVDWGDGSPIETVSADKTHTYSTAGTHTIILSPATDRWTFQNVYKPLVPTNGTTVDVKIAYMPSLADGFGNSETNPGNYFFYYFNNNGKLTSLPSGSFDTSKITTVGGYFFSSFNNNGKLTSLPEGSFDTSNITSVENYFFNSFNYKGQLTNLPEGSFRFSTGLTTAGNYFFWGFNEYGALTSLPEGSFDTSHIIPVGYGFFASFNRDGALTSLPEGSFRFSTGLTAVGNNFFQYFNDNGQLTSLPEGSFDTSNITSVGTCFFQYFSANGQLISLPDGSFDISNIKSVGDSFFTSFNSYGALTSLPEGSFDTSKITTVGYHFFSYFNQGGQLTSLPEGSFDTSNITTAGNYFFSQFNRDGQLTGLPDGSFDMSNITSGGVNFLYYFNYNGKITALPDSFKLSPAGVTSTNGYLSAFSSTYTLNKRVSDLVAGLTPPNSDRNTFSDNQPGRCGVNPNWLLSASNACSIIYDANGGTGSVIGGYNSITTRVIAGSNIISPTKEGYVLSEWHDISGNTVNEVIFPDMDGKTLYAQWEECDSGYVVNSTGTSCVLKEYNITYNLGGGYLEDGEGNQYEGNQVVTYTYNSTGNKYIADLERESVKKENSVFLGRYIADDGGEKVDDITSINIAGEILYAHWNDCESGYTLNNLRTTCVLKEYNITYDLRGGYLEDGEGNQYEGNQVVTYTYNLTGNKYVADLVWNSVKRENSTFIGWYTIDGNVFDFGTILPENNTAYAKYECDLGYLEDETKSSCEKIRVEFDANGGSFEDGEKIFQTEISFVEIPFFETKILHTPNLTDEGNYLTGTPPNGCTKANGSSNVEIYVASTGYIQIEGAKELRISIKYGGGSYGSWIGTINVWTGNNGNRLPVRSLISFPVYESYETSEFIVEGDSIYIAQSSGYPNYGRFITVSGTGKREVAEYPDGVFNNILPIREGHNFMGRYLADGIKFNTGTVSTGEITYVHAKRGCADGYENKGGECIKQETKPSYSGGGGGGGGGATKPDTPKEEQKPADSSEQVPQNDNSVSSGANVKTSENESSEQTPQNDSNTPMDSSTSSQNDEKIYSTEFQEAYEFAKGNGITTMPTIQKADMSGKLTRIQMAKMLSQYAINVLGQTPDTSKKIKFKDVTKKKDAEYDNGVTLAYQLGIMGQNMKNNKFRPNDEVSRAEFVTALSRLLYSTSDGEYKSTSKYYIHHMEKLVKEGIITVDDPKMKERRGYVMIMLMRSAK